MDILFQVDQRVEFASTLPSTFYTSSEVFEKSKEQIFSKSWQFCFDKEALQEPGTQYPLTLLPGMLDEPLLFINNHENQLRCVSNVCTHRASILVSQPCKGEFIKCPYHGRRFNLDGKFMHMPEFEEAKNFPSASDHLPSVDFATFGQFIFASLSPSVPFNTVMREIIQRLSWLPLESMRLMRENARDYRVNAHWALYIENYLEGLHIPFVHKTLRSLLDFKNYSYEIYPYSNLQLALANKDEHAFAIPQGEKDHGKRIAAYYYWIFPNTMLNFYPWGCSVNVVKPVSKTETMISFLPFVYNPSLLHTGAGGDLNTVELEDEAIVELVQRGIKSRFYNSGRYSPTMEKGTHHFHQLICESMKT